MAQRTAPAQRVRPRSDALIFSQSPPPGSSGADGQRLLVERVQVSTKPRRATWLAVLATASFAGATGRRASDRVLGTMSATYRRLAQDPRTTLAGRLQESVREANTAAMSAPIYSSALDPQTIELIAFALHRERLAVARVGRRYGYLVRASRMTPLVGARHAPQAAERSGRRGHAVGAAADVETDLAECEVHPSDLLILATHELSDVLSAADLERLVAQPEVAADVVVARLRDGAHAPAAAVTAYLAATPARGLRIGAPTTSAIFFAVLVLVAAVATFATLMFFNIQIVSS